MRDRDAHTEIFAGALTNQDRARPPRARAQVSLRPAAPVFQASDKKLMPESERGDYRRQLSQPSEAADTRYSAEDSTGLVPQIRLPNEIIQQLETAANQRQPGGAILPDCAHRMTSAVPAAGSRDSGPGARICGAITRTRMKIRPNRRRRDVIPRDNSPACKSAGDPEARQLPHLLRQAVGMPPPPAAPHPSAK